MNKKVYAMLDRIKALGISHDDAVALRRISMTLHRWFELECGDGRGGIERDEVTGKPCYHYANMADTYRTYRFIPDRETGARKRLDKIMEKYPYLIHYIQTDPRGCSLYVMRKSDLQDSPIDQVYHRGVAVHK